MNLFHTFAAHCIVYQRPLIQNGFKQTKFILKDLASEDVPDYRNYENVSKMV
jgi:hypothetical protein